MIGHLGVSTPGPFLCTTTPQPQCIDINISSSVYTGIAGDRTQVANHCALTYALTLSATGSLTKNMSESENSYHCQVWSREVLTYITIFLTKPLPQQVLLDIFDIIGETGWWYNDNKSRWNDIFNPSWLDTWESQHQGHSYNIKYIQQYLLG